MARLTPSSTLEEWVFECLLSWAGHPWELETCRRPKQANNVAAGALMAMTESIGQIVEERSWPGFILGLPERPIPPANAIPSYAPAQAPSSNYDQTVPSDCWPHAR
jgi:hypothetical protein